MAFRVEDVWPVWEFECPKCGEITNFSDGEFESDVVDGMSVEVAYGVCDVCLSDLEVIKPE